MLRITKIVLILFVCLWGVFSAMSNLGKWQSDTLGNVAMATSMSTINGGEESWKATTNPIVIWLGGLFIVGSKIVSAALCAEGGRRMWRERKSDADRFAASKELALAGCAVAVIMLFGGFIVIAEGWYELWRSPTLGAPVLGTALRYASMIALIGIFVGMKET